MKKVCKSVLMCLLLAAVVLCLAGCGDGAKGDPAGNPLIQYNETAVQCYYLEANDTGTVMQLYIQKIGEDEYAILITFMDTSLSMTEDYFSYGVIEGAQNQITSTQSLYSYSFQVIKTGLTKTTLQSGYLPASSPWVVKLEKTGEPGRTKQMTIPANIVTKINAWIAAH